MDFFGLSSFVSFSCLSYDTEKVDFLKKIMSGPKCKYHYSLICMHKLFVVKFFCYSYVSKSDLLQYTAKLFSDVYLVHVLFPIQWLQEIKMVW